MQKSKEGHPISEEFNSLLKGIDEMIPACLQEKLARHARLVIVLSFKLKKNKPYYVANEIEKLLIRHFNQYVKRVNVETFNHKNNVTGS